MAGAGIEVKLDREYEKILEALGRASSANLLAVARFAGGEFSKKRRRL
jgi:hypothetical protein